MTIWNSDEKFEEPTKERLREALKSLEGKHYPHQSTPPNDLIHFKGMMGVEWRSEGYKVDWRYSDKVVESLTLDELVDFLWKRKEF